MSEEPQNSSEPRYVNIVEIRLGSSDYRIVTITFARSVRCIGYVRSKGSREYE